MPSACYYCITVIFSLICLCKYKSLCTDDCETVKLDGYLKILCKGQYFSKVDSNKDYTIVVKIYTYKILT